MSLPTGLSLSPDGYLLASSGRDKVRTQNLILSYSIQICYSSLSDDLIPFN